MNSVLKLLNNRTILNCVKFFLIYLHAVPLLLLLIVQVERLASQFQDEFNEWLRRHEASTPYEMVTAARELRRLKAENKQLRAAKLGVHPATPSRAAGGQETKRRSISGHGQINGRSRNAIMR